MLRRTLNLGILAHVDAGKTTLTERLLFEAGVIDTAGSVDAGTTQTDSMELERQRGITIRSAVVSFPIDDASVNLIDTPGHPDFIAEVERVLSVLDGAVLVISAVEGVQPQTRVLMRALQRLRVPTVMFVNKIDRGGADGDRVLAEVTRRLTPAAVPMGAIRRPGTPAAEFTACGAGDEPFRTTLIEVLSERSDALLAAYVQDETAVDYPRLRKELAAQARRAEVHPVYFGSAVTGAGIAPLRAGLVELLPATIGDANGPVSGQVFTIARGRAGEKVAYVRMFTGTLHTRDRVRFGADLDGKVTAVNVFDSGSGQRPGPVRAGEIATVRGLDAVKVGDPVGEPRAAAGRHRFPPPTLETVVAASRPEDRAALRVALSQLAEQDPLINVRQDDLRQELSVTLYGEVQKEVIQSTLADDFGIEVSFRRSTTLCIERPVGTGEAREMLHGDGNPFRATIGLRVEPAPPDSGVDFRLGVDARTVPMYVYKNTAGFAEMMGQYVRRTLREGLRGWQVTDCTVTMVDCNYSSPDGPPSTRGPLSTPADFRDLAPLVLMQALAQAGTAVCEPVVRVRLETPTGAVGAVVALLPRLGAAVQSPSLQQDLAVIEAVLPAARITDLQRRLPGLTGGEGVFESTFAGYQPVTGPPPVRPRTMPDPLDRNEYLHRAGIRKVAP